MTRSFIRDLCRYFVVVFACSCIDTASSVIRPRTVQRVLNILDEAVLNGLLVADVDRGLSGTTLNESWHSFLNRYLGVRRGTENEDTRYLKVMMIHMRQFADKLAKKLHISTAESLSRVFVSGDVVVFSKDLDSPELLRQLGSVMQGMYLYFFVSYFYRLL